MGFNSAFKGLTEETTCTSQNSAYSIKLLSCF